MSDAREPLTDWRDPLVASALLTRIPVPVNPDLAGRRIAAASWAWPLVGAALGALAGLAGWGAQALGVAPAVAAAMALAVPAVLTGALHEDGLADCADGLFGGRDRERRLAIMKDSRIGAFGALALVLTVLARWAAVADLPGPALPLALSLCGAISRAPMALAMALMPAARPDGLSRHVGQPPAGAVLLGLGLTLAFALGFGGLAALLAGWAAAFALALVALRKLGGQTGDVLGGMQQVAEVAALAALTALK